MSDKQRPKVYERIRHRHGKFIDALETLGKTAREEGPLDNRTAHLVQLAAAAAIRSEGSVHSHARRALEAGASEEEIYHAVIVLTSTIGFPAVAAAISWINDVTATG